MELMYHGISVSHKMSFCMFTLLIVSEKCFDMNVKKKLLKISMSENHPSVSAYGVEKQWFC